MKQVEELKRKLEAEEQREKIRRGRKEARVGGESRGRKEARGGEYMMGESGTGGIASRAMGSAVHMGQLGMDNNNRQLYFPNKQQQHGGHRRHHQWSKGWNGQLPSHGGGQTRRQPYQQQLLQPHHSFHHASPKCGIGGPFDCGSNATGWYQEESPLPPNSPMDNVYQCKRCGRLGHMAQICTTPQRFEGTCNSCGQYGHRYHNCITNKYHTHAHAKVISYPSGFSRRGSRNMPCPRQQQQQQAIVNGTMPWSQKQPQQQQQQQQPQQQLISYDSDGGWVRGGINGVPVYFHLVVTGVTAVDNNGTHVVTALSMDLVVATSAMVTATTATPLLPVVVVHRRIG